MSTRKRPDNQSVMKDDATALSQPATSAVGGSISRMQINPLANISFDQSYDPKKFAQGIEDNVSAAIKISHGVRAANLALQIEKLNHGGLLVHLQDSQYELVKTADGVFKAMTRGANGQIHEIAAVDPFGTYLTKFAQAGALVVTVANIISSADISIRLGQVQSDVDDLLKYRQVDIIAAIRTAYESLREELSKEKPNAESVEKLRDEFRQNRHRLFGEVRSDVAGLKYLFRSEQTGITSKTKLWELNKRLKGVNVSLWDKLPENMKQVKQVEQVKGWAQPTMDQALSYREQRLKAGREVDLQKIIAKVRLGVYCLQMEGVASTFSGSSNDQDKLNQEAAIELREIALLIEPLEREIGDELRFSMPISQTANVWNVPA